MSGRAGVHRIAWSCGQCREAWEAARRAEVGYVLRVRGPGDFERWADARGVWVLHARLVAEVRARWARDWAIARRSVAELVGEVHARRS